VISRCSGDGGSSPAWVRRAIFPNSVCIPVANTSAFPSPATIVLPASSTLGARNRSSSVVAAAVRAFGSDSPVMVARFTRTANASTRRQSAGTFSPSPTRTTSPGTSASAGSRHAAPSRSAVTWCGNSRFSAAIARSARYSCQKENAPFTAMTPTIAQPSVAMPSAGS
jgi:hypothetical protein